jgi:hypothetical protein
LEGGGVSSFDNFVFSITINAIIAKISTKNNLLVSKESPIRVNVNDTKKAEKKAIATGINAFHL